MKKGSGIGRATAQSFARAGTSKIVLIGRDASKLDETKKSLSCETSIHALDVTDEQALNKLATEIGRWDVLVLAAGYLEDQKSVQESSVDDWWQSFEVVSSLE